MFNGIITRVYFPRPPNSVHLSIEIKSKFENNVDRTSTKTKLEYFLDQAPYILEELKYEHKLQKLFERNMLVNLSMKNVPLWRDMVYYITIALNLIILFSYSEYGTDRLDEPSLFYKESGDNDAGLSSGATIIVIYLLGAALTFNAFVIASYYVMKTVPLHFSRSWRKQNPALKHTDRAISTRKWMVKFIQSIF